ncbi:MAG: hypothetical protein ACI9XO_001200 [Paraglaciecola sp.]|jgi:hypothetical protein
MVQLIKSFFTKEYELNKLRLLRGYFALIFHFENAPIQAGYHININRTFKTKRRTKRLSHKSKLTLGNNN